MQQGQPPCLLPAQAEGVWAFPARSAGESSPPRDKTVAAGGVVMYRYGFWLCTGMGCGSGLHVHVHFTSV